MTRPESILQRATEETFIAPGEEWDGDPTKVRPSTDTTAMGYVPDDPPPAEYTNWYNNHRDAMLAYLDKIQIHNWITTSEIDSTQIHPTTPFPIAMVWSETNQRVYFHHQNNATNLAKGRVSRHGRSWINDDAFPASTSRLVMSAENNGYIISVSDTNTKTVLNSGGAPPAGNWTDVIDTDTDATSHNGVIWGGTLDRFVIGSEFNAGASTWSGRIVLLDNVGVYDDTIVLSVPAGYPTSTANGPDIFAINAAGNRVMLAASNTGGSTPATWISDEDDPTTWTLGRILGTGTISALAFDPVRGLWQAWCGTALHESADGVAWTLRTANPGFGCALNQFLIVGSYYVALHISDGTIRYSTDEGENWMTLLFPHENESDDFDGEVYKIFWLRDRFVAVSYDSNNGFPFLAQTLRLP